MKHAGITPVMITGDNRRTADAVAGQVGVERVLAEVLPDDKADEIRRLQREGQRVAMVGDGINDAPALTQADVGFAIGAGTDIAVESADIVIMSDRLGAVMDAREIGVRSYRRTKQNLALAFVFNGIGVPTATTGLVHPIWAMVAMVASVTTVLVNSFRGRLLHRLRGASAGSPEAQIEQQHVREHDHGGLEPPEEVEHAYEAPAAERPRQAPEHAEQRVIDVERARHGEGAHTLQLKVPTHCHNCAQRVETRVGALRGVQGVRADHEHDQVTVEHTTEVFEGQIRAKLHDMGFDVEGHADEEASA
jgi:cation transport ATPase